MDEKDVSLPLSGLGQCSECGAAFPERAGQVTCAAACRKERTKRLAREAQVGAMFCPDCGVMVESADWRRWLCPECSNTRNRVSMQRCRRRRKARQRGALHEPYTLAEIAARDNYQCGICRMHVILGLVVPHPEAPTIDHLIPISDGGNDVKANVQLAHFICNSRRGAGGVVQLRLIG